MLFSGLVFLFLYLIAVLLLMTVTPKRWRYLALLAVSLLFYGWGEPKYVLLMILSILIGFVHGGVIARLKAHGNDRAARIAVISAVVCNLSLLLFFKYWDFIAGSFAAVGLPLLPALGLPLPIGISFYTFQTMSYPIDVYRGDASEQKNPAKFGMFVTLFPQLIAGPIVKYKELERQLDHIALRAEPFASGVQLFTVGLAKKVLIANNIGSLWDVYNALPVAQLTVAGAWLGIAAFALQIYFDFSGYSDMAIGLGRMLGFEFPINFDYPYIAKSVTEFWRRWHISLGSWFREYVYIPLGGNRVGSLRLCLNLFVVWGLTGIWHGASWNFLLWGVYFGILILLEKLVWGKLLAKLPAAVGHVYTLLLVLVSWVIFAVEDLSALGGYISALFGFAPGGLISGQVYYHAQSYLPLLLLSAVAATPIGARLWSGIKDRRVARVILPVLILGVLLLSTAYIVDATYNPFLYFRF